MYLELPEDSVTYLVYRGTHWHLVRILWLAGVWLHKCQLSTYTLRDGVRCTCCVQRAGGLSPLPYSCDWWGLVYLKKPLKIAFSDSSALQYFHLNIPKCE